MTTPQAAPSDPPRKTGLSRRLRWLLIGSLTLNLLVAGMVAGVALRHAGGDRMPPPAARSLGFGPWQGGLSREDHKALRQAYEAGGHDFRAAWREDRADRAALVAALRAEPFDPGALDAIVLRMQARAVARMDLGERLIRDHVLAMTPEVRHAFADRLESWPRRDRDGREHRRERPGD